MSEAHEVIDIDTWTGLREYDVEDTMLKKFDVKIEAEEFNFKRKLAYVRFSGSPSDLQSLHDALYQLEVAWTKLGRYKASPEK